MKYTNNKIKNLILKMRKEKKFISLATAEHNATIENIYYSNPRITKPLLYIGLFLPDFKISWLILGLYLFVKYPISLKVRVREWVRDKRTTLYLLVLKRRYKKK